MPDLTKPVSMNFIIITIAVLLFVTAIGILAVNYKTKKMKENK